MFMSSQKTRAITHPKNPRGTPLSKSVKMQIPKGIFSFFLYERTFENSDGSLSPVEQNLSGNII